MNFGKKEAQQNEYILLVRIFYISMHFFGQREMHRRLALLTSRPYQQESSQYPELVLETICDARDAACPTERVMTHRYQLICI